MDIESYVKAPLRCIVGSEREWDAVRPLTSIHPDSSFTAPAPDFDREMLVVAAMGARPTPNYDIAVDGTWLRGDTLVVELRNTEPVGEIQENFGTSPVVVVKVPRASTVYFLEHG
jgi:hypothetical protein